MHSYSVLERLHLEEIETERQREGALVCLHVCMYMAYCHVFESLCVRVQVSARECVCVSVCECVCVRVFFFSSPWMWNVCACVYARL
jgi:hypothetical protein